MLAKLGKVIHFFETSISSHELDRFLENLFMRIAWPILFQYDIRSVDRPISGNSFQFGKWPGWLFQNSVYIIPLSSKIGHDLIFYRNWIVTYGIRLTEFSRNQFCYWKKDWTTFQELVRVSTRRTEISENIWMNFPGFANKG